MAKQRTQRERNEHERGYIEGNKSAYQLLLIQCIQHLGGEDRNKESWRLERAAAIAALRRLCAEHGDNDWPDSLNLADVIDKHLGRYLE